MCKHIHLVCYYLNMTKNNHLLNNDGIIYYDYISVDHQQTINLNQSLSTIVNVQPTLNIISSFQDDVITSITDGTNSMSRVIDSYSSSINTTDPVVTNEYSAKISNSNELSANLVQLENGDGIHHPETNETSNMDNLIETLDQRRTALSQKILDLLEYVENVESVEMVDAIEKLLLPVESTLATLKRL